VADFRHLAGSSVKRTAVLGIGVLAIQLTFIFSYVGGLGRPYPHGLPIAIVGPAPIQRAIISTVESRGGAIHPHAYPTDRSAITAIETHRVDAAVLIGVQKDQLVIAGAPSPAVGQVVQKVFGSLEARAHRPYSIRTVVPLSPNDPEGLAPFYLIVGWVVGGYLLASLIGLARGTEPSLRFAAFRLGALAAFATVSGLAGVALAGPGMGLFGGNRLAEAGVGGLVVFGVAALTTAFQVVIGELGIVLAILLFVVLGNPSSGGPYPRELLNGVWRTIGAYIPNGAGLDAERNIAYFGSNAIVPAIIVLGTYGLVGIGITLGMSWAREARRQSDRGN
jgi:hypothetical protein